MRNYLFFIILTLLLIACNSAEMHHNKANNLIHETSPYLLQHAYNPVNWYPWGNKALEKAKKENKLIIVSIGYSSCHWCHVMERESFEDNEVAKIMNEHFVSIKVDREERPDVDDVYMTACNLITGQGGWPLNAVALPDGRPVWAGTYFPRDVWINNLKQFVRLKEEHYDRLENAANQILMGLKQVDQVLDVSAPLEFSKEELRGIGEQFLSNVDFDYGGIGAAPKFPMPNNIEFLMKYAFAFQDSTASEAVSITLREMAKGGIYDQVEGGFARYSVDKYWRVPHFEKMLYDNAQLIALYSDAYRFSGDATFKQTALETIDFVRKRWLDESGGYYSSYDADSEGEEGKFYVWDHEELKELLSDDNDFLMFADYFTITEKGNWESANILYTLYDDNDFADKYGFDPAVFKEKKEGWKALLREHRKSRPLPGLDDKILCSWNALLIKAYASAWKAFGEEQFKTFATDLWKFIYANLLEKDGVTLKRNYKNGQATIDAFLDDYALLVSALLDLYEITFEEDYLQKANHLTGHVLEHFKSNESSMFQFTSDLSPPLIARKSELSDNVIPGSNSVMARNLHRLGHLLYNDSYLKTAHQMISNMKNTIVNTGQPNFYSNWCNLFFDMVFAPYEVAIVGEKSDSISEQLQKRYHPNAIFLGGKGEGGMALLQNKLVDGETMIYVCVNKSCKMPVKDIDSAWKLMQLAGY